MVHPVCTSYTQLYVQLMLLYIAQKQSLEENCEEVNNFISLAHEILRLQGVMIK